MTFGVITTIVGEIDAYDRLHRALLQRTGGVLDGMLLHLARQTGDGFQIVEIWETKEQFERCNREIVWPLAAEIAAGLPPDAPVIEEFDPRGLILSGVRIEIPRLAGSQL